MMSILLEEITKKTLYIALEIVNSNPAYNFLENGQEMRSEANMTDEFLNEKATSMFVKLDDTYIGVIDYIMENPKDQHPWLGLLIIHHDYQGYGFGRQTYFLYEEIMRKKGVPSIRLGVLKENHRALQFWESLGFHFVKMARVDHLEKEIKVLEKRFL